MKLSKSLKKRLCEQLRSYDPEIVEIVQFGSSVYASEYARDLDLLVFTKAKKDYGGYLDAVDALNLPFNVDMIVNEVDESLGGLRVGVLGAHEILHGDGSYLQRVVGSLDNPTYEESWAKLKNAQRAFKLGSRIKDKMEQDDLYRIAFDALFHASRIASMTYLSMERGGWSKIKQRLPKRLREEFSQYINTLHVSYFYNGNYSKDRVKEEFERWQAKVEDYIKGLEGQAKQKKRETKKKKIK